MAYRYRYTGGTTHGAISKFDKIISKLGEILEVKGYRYFGKYASTEAVMIKGINGTARFANSLTWGYSGKGPRGTAKLLKKLGINEYWSKKVALDSKRDNTIGVDWKLKKENGCFKVVKLTIVRTSDVLEITRNRENNLNFRTFVP